MCGQTKAKRRQKVTCSVFSFTCWFYFLLLCSDDPAERQHTHPPRPHPPLPSPLPSSWEGRGQGWCRERERENETGWMLKWEHLTTCKVRERKNAAAKKPKQRSRLNGFLSFSVSLSESRRTGGGTRLSHSLYYGWDVSGCFKRLVFAWRDGEMSGWRWRGSRDARWKDFGGGVRVHVYVR